jgi:hypothetical protein
MNQDASMFISSSIKWFLFFKFLSSYNLD